MHDQTKKAYKIVFILEDHLGELISILIGRVDKFQNNGKTILPLS